MIEPRDFEPRESILSDDLKTTRPRAPLKSLAGERKQGHRVDHEGKLPMAVVGLPRRGLGNLRRGRKSWFPNKNAAARSATSPSSISERSSPRTPTRALPSPTAGSPRPGHSSAPVSAYPAEVKRLPFRAPRGCGPQEARTWLRQNPAPCGPRTWSIPVT